MRKLKRLIIYTIGLILINHSCHGIENKEWICSHTLFNNDPFIILFVNDSVIKFHDGCLDTKYLNNELSEDKTAILKENNVNIGNIEFISKNEIKLTLNHIKDDPIKFHPFNFAETKNEYYSTIDIKSKLKGIWKLNLNFNGKEFNCKIDFLDENDMIFGYKDADQYDNYLFKWEIIEYNSIIILRLFDVAPLYFIIDKIEEDKIILKSFINSKISFSELNKIEDVKNDLTLELEKIYWKVKYNFNEKTISGIHNNYLNYNALKFSNGTYLFSNYEINNLNQYFGGYKMSHDNNYIIFDNNRKDMFQIKQDSNLNKIVLKMISDHQEFEMILSKYENNLETLGE